MKWLRRVPWLPIIFLHPLVIWGIFGLWLYPHDPTAMDLSMTFRPPAFAGGTWSYFLGTDRLGHDLLSQLILGARASLLVSISAGYPGAKEWVQFAVAPYPDKFKLVAGCTGVQSPLMFPYLPQQLAGLLAAIKGGAEYEKLVNDKYGGPSVDPKYREASRRMGPQLVAHLLMIALIITGNVIYFVQRRRERRR